MSPGLCKTCRHARTLANDRGSVFYHCGLSETNARFPRYPRLPVRECEGYEEKMEGEKEGKESTP